ncbi:hypothetical protein COL940_009261 [Colletotrichum noveboracense]|nr:hypothetical protein COL940_009261 [Colletotrichum noveboracense]
MGVTNLLASGLLLLALVQAQSTAPAWGQLYPGIKHTNNHIGQSLKHTSRNWHQYPCYDDFCDSDDNSSWRRRFRPHDPCLGYLQAKPTGAPSKAYLDSPSTAGQFKIEDGQLVHLTGSSSLYLNVENPADKTQRKLETWFATTKNTYGTFAFQGDTLTWSTPDINRPNLAAWLVCENQEVFINTGAYLYQTPAGCYDQTIHSYGGSTADL